MVFTPDSSHLSFIIFCIFSLKKHGGSFRGISYSVFRRRILKLNDKKGFRKDQNLCILYLIQESFEFFSIKSIDEEKSGECKTGTAETALFFVGDPSNELQS